MPAPAPPATPRKPDDTDDTPPPRPRRSLPLRTWDIARSQLTPYRPRAANKKREDSRRLAPEVFTLKFKLHARLGRTFFSSPHLVPRCATRTFRSPLPSALPYLRLRR